MAWSVSDVSTIILIGGYIAERLILAWRGHPLAQAALDQTNQLQSQVADLAKNAVPPQMATALMAAANQISTVLKNLQQLQHAAAARAATAAPPTVQAAVSPVTVVMPMPNEG